MMSSGDDGGVGIILNTSTKSSSTTAATTTTVASRQRGPELEPKLQTVDDSSFASIDFTSQSDLAAGSSPTASSSVKSKLSALKNRSPLVVNSSSGSASGSGYKKRLQWNDLIASSTTGLEEEEEEEEEDLNYHHVGRGKASSIVAPHQLRMAPDSADNNGYSDRSDSEFGGDPANSQYESKYREMMQSIGSLEEDNDNEPTTITLNGCDSNSQQQQSPLSFADQLRQQKVMEMAKKSRRLYVALERERSKSKILLRRVQELESLNTLGNQQQNSPTVTSSQNSIARGSAGSGIILPSTADTSTAFDMQASFKQLKDRMNQMTKRLEEEKTQNHLLKQELRQAQRALCQEVGEEMSIQKILNSGNGWKGRAQQIASLRDKVSRLTSQLQQIQQQQNTSQQPHTSDAHQLKKQQHPKIPGGTIHHAELTLVDKQDPLWQQQQSVEKQRQRQQLQQAQSELSAYQGKYESLNTKFQSLKTRSGVLEDTVKELKSQIQVLMEKNDIDDQMITNLKIQLSKLQVKHDPTPPPLAKDFDEREQYLKRLREILREMDDHRNRLRMKSELYATEHVMAALNTENAMLWEMQRELECRLENAEHYCRQLATDLYKEKHKLNPVPLVKSSAAIKDDTLVKMQKKMELQTDEIQALKSTLESITEQKNQDLKSYQQLIRHLKQQQNLDE